MDSKHLRAFMMVAEELNFRQAADRLNMTQPPLTRMISQLESDLRVKLFNRTTRSVELTGAGLHLFKRGREILDQMALVELEVRMLQKSKNGRLSISLDRGALHTALPRLISSFKEQFPNITISLIEYGPHTIAQNLRAAKVDVFFGATVFKDSSFIQTKVQVQELGLLVPKENPLALKKKLRLRDLNGETLIFHGKQEHLGFQEEFLEYLLSKGVIPRVYYKKSKESCGLLVRGGKGLLLCSKRSAHANPESVYIPLEDYSPKLKIYATWREENTSFPLKVFVNFLSDSSIPSSEMDGHLG